MIESTLAEPSARAVQRFKALGDPTRLHILHVLAAGTRCACEVQGQVDVAANLLSHHLKVLREAGLIRGARRGRWIDYELDPDGLAAVCAALPKPAAGRIEASCACDRREVDA
ncbi:MAG: metalloregulator ArsR/SmtB family transcription factor [Trueperaceae bacterium]|nr:metalloregulator ArsR/SmtB family transcription factor [Trueperaceae bacterium]